MTAKLFDDDTAVRFRGEVREWTQSALPSSWAAVRGVRLPAEQSLEMRRLWDKLQRDGGYAGLSWPTEYGGRGLGVIEECIFYEEAARAGAPDTLNFVGMDLVGPAIIAAGTDEQKEKYLPKILSGEELWCEGFSEPAAGSDLAAVTTTAYREENSDEFLVTGQKVWTTFAHLADRCYLLCRSSKDAPRRANLSILLINMHQPGIEVRGIRQITGDCEFNEVFFDNARAPISDLLGEENKGWSLASLAGGVRNERRAFDALRRRVAIEELLREYCRSASNAKEIAIAAELRGESDVLEWHIRRCIELSANAQDPTRSSSILRIVWTQLWQKIVLAGIQLSDGKNEDYWRHEFLYSRYVTIAGGTSQIQRNIIADRVLAIPR
jgi:alkylation response protein AidB-like acyl-CoA dehydrogenase